MKKLVARFVKNLISVVCIGAMTLLPLASSAVGVSYAFFARSGSLAIFGAIRRASSLVSSLAAARTAGFFLVIK